MSSGLPWSSFLIYIFHLCFMGRIPPDIRSTKKLDVNDFQVASVHLSLVTFLLQSLRQGVSGVKSLREWVMLSARSLMHDFQAFSEWFGNLDLDSPPDLSQLSLFFVTFFFLSSFSISLIFFFPSCFLSCPDVACPDVSCLVLSRPGLFFLSPLLSALLSSSSLLSSLLSRGVKSCSVQKVRNNNSPTELSLVGGSKNSLGTWVFV